MGKESDGGIKEQAARHLVLFKIYLACLDEVGGDHIIRLVLFHLPADIQFIKAGPIGIVEFDKNPDIV